MKKENIYLLPRECERCKTIVYYRSINRKQYSRWTEGATQSGMSKKYCGENAGWCKEHKSEII